ncbi:hypothetical protein HL667_00045 [Bradyrhizobium sp. 83012]|uniref:Uncharacterized protein n=1 Tax=Bradyrhizobium aeschynomenes TaxID=2734909 RepID=A0ABX2C539_9BRAD|nr:hypothetical protein [Bradyrhizobium aeschynomenes]NPU63386.1 hypothetical protein [Bradyrhizobium aeschynomenes]
MADLTITAANVVQGAEAVTEDGLAGETITQGQQVYWVATEGKYYKADCDSATAAVRSPRGVALNAASANQPLRIQKSGDITIGATLTAGTAYYLSKTAGGICPLADVAGGYPVIVGIAKSATVLKIGYLEAGVAI